MVRTKQASKRPLMGSRFTHSIKPARKSAPAEPRNLALVDNVQIPIITARKSVNRVRSSGSKGVKRTLRQPIESSRFVINSIPKIVFQKLCRDIAYKFMPGCRFSLAALGALQMAVEDYMVGFMEDAAAAMRHAGRRTLMQKDFELIKKLRKMDYNDKF